MQIVPDQVPYVAPALVPEEGDHPAAEVGSVHLGQEGDAGRENLGGV
jgi:hypothetical protein